MREVDLTDSFIKALAPEDQLLEVGDSRTPGLRLRVRPSGRKVWTFRFRLGGRTLRKSYQPQYPHLTLKQARSMALQDLATVARGEDPRLPCSGTERTFADLVEEFERSRLSELAPKTRSEYERILKRDLLPTLGRLSEDDIDTRMVVEILDRVAKRGPVIANRTRAVLSSVFSNGRRRGLQISNPVQGTQTRREGRRHRHLSDEEIRLVWKEFCRLPPPGGLAMRLLLCTGQRSKEVRLLEAGDIHTHEDTTTKGSWWMLPGDIAKNRREHLIPLEGVALQILAEARYYSRSHLLFESSLSPEKAMDENTLPQAARRICNRLDWTGRQRFTPHDLRRTFETQLGRLGVRH